MNQAEQEIQTLIRGGESLMQEGGEAIGKAVAIDTTERTIDIRKSGKTADIHPEAVYKSDIYGSKEQANALLRIGEYVAEHGMEGDGPYLAARALLLRDLPRIADQPIRQANEAPLDAALRIATHLDGGILPIQGPPGTGKTHTGARMICRLVERGLKVSTPSDSAPPKQAANTGCESERVLVMAAVLAEILAGWWFAQHSAMMTLPRYCAAW